MPYLESLILAFRSQAVEFIYAIYTYIYAHMFVDLHLHANLYNCGSSSVNTFRSVCGLAALFGRAAAVCPTFM